MPDLSSSLRNLIDEAAAPVDVDALVRDRRHRRARRRASIGAAVMVVAVLVASGVIVERAPGDGHKVVSVGNEPTREADATRTALEQLTFLSPSGGAGGFETEAPKTITITDAASGRSTESPFPLASAHQLSVPFLVIGSNLVFVAGLEPGHPKVIGTAYAVSSTLQQWRALRSASYAVAATDADGVWLVTDTGSTTIMSNGQGYAPAHNVQEVHLDGGASSPLYPLTEDRTIMGAVNGGLLTERRDAAKRLVYEVWNPATDHVLRRLAIDLDGELQSIRGRAVAWIEPGCVSELRCVLHVTDVVTGADREIAPPADKVWWGASLSPDGTQLAAVAVSPHLLDKFPSRRRAGDRVADLAIIAIDTGRVTTREVSGENTVPANLLWSPDGMLVFVSRNGSHLAYVNAAFPSGPVRSVAVDRPWEALAVTKAVNGTTAERYEYDGLVQAEKSHSAELCIYATFKMLGEDGCNGPLVAGWNPKTPTGNYHLVGTYDGGTFTLTESPRSARPVREEPLPNFKTRCSPPAGGWTVRDPARVGYEDNRAMVAAARNAPDFAGLWIDQSTAPAGAQNDFAHDVFNVAFTGNIDTHRAELAALWGGPMCVIQRPHSYKELERITVQLSRGVGRELGLQVMGVGPDDVDGFVLANVVVTDAARQREVDERFGAGVVRLVGQLKPVVG